jgi:hypothetical protein
MKRKQNGPKTRKFVQELPVELDLDELEDRRERLVNVELKLDQLEAERTKTLEGLNDRKTTLVLERKGLLETLQAKTEKRTVDCEARVDFERNREVIVRVDTGEQIEERALTGDERHELAQEGMFGSDGEDKSAKPEPRA